VILNIPAYYFFNAQPQLRPTITTTHGLFSSLVLMVDNEIELEGGVGCKNRFKRGLLYNNAVKSMTEVLYF
jgi:hypothetical protein